MTPLPVNPTVVIRVDNGKVVAVASNIAPVPELNVVIAESNEKYDEEAKGKPFNQAV